MSIQRYDLIDNQEEYAPAEMIGSSDGDYVLFTDHITDKQADLDKKEKATVLYQAALAWISTYAHLATPALVAEKAYAALVEVDPSLPQWEPRQNMKSVEEANKKLVAEVERLTAERDEAVRARDYLYNGVNEALHPNGGGPERPAGCDLVGYLKYDLQQLRAERDKMRNARDILRQVAEKTEELRAAAVWERGEACEALRPFAALGMSPYEGSRDGRTFYQLNETEITVGDIRRARAALVKIEGGRG